MTETHITFPDFIEGNDSFQNRKVLIHIKESPTFKGDYDTIVKNLKDKGEEILNAAKSKNAKRFRDSLNTGKTILTLALPIPNSLSDSLGHSWEKDTGVASKLKDFIAGKDSLIGKVTGGMSSALGNISDSTGIRKPMVDPAFFQNYTGSELRTFRLSFDLVPNNKHESKNIIKIIKALKKYSSPEIVIASALMLAPHFFDIEFGNDTVDTLMGIKGVVLTNIEVNYGASGQMAYVGNDGMIKHTSLALTFAERRLSTAEQWDINE